MENGDGGIKVMNGIQELGLCLREDMRGDVAAGEETMADTGGEADTGGRWFEIRYLKFGG
jgi:hypothetical protein